MIILCWLICDKFNYWLMQGKPVKRIQGYLIDMGSKKGQGVSGAVYTCKQDKTNLQLAVKIISKQNIQKDEYLKAALTNEINILKKLRSERIILLYDVKESNQNYYLVQELCDADLYSQMLVGRRNKVFQQREALDILKQICQGFLVLVREGIIHRDLKPQNIMRKGQFLKLGDFGFAQQLDPNSTTSGCVGSPLYMSLQILHNQRYTSKCDIWSLGVLFYELLHGDTPWTASNPVQLARNIQTKPLKITRQDLSKESKDFIQKTLALQEKDRISWNQIFLHPIFKGYFQTKSNQFKQFENRMKYILNEVRFYIAQRNLNMNKILDSLGFGLDKSEISFHDLYRFFQRTNPQITRQEVDYLFKKADTDNSDSISIDQLKNLLIQHGIKLEQQFSTIPAFQPNQDNSESFQKISEQKSQKIKNCFKKLYQVISPINMSLEQIYKRFDANHKKKLTLEDFTQLIEAINKGQEIITQEEIRYSFQIIDEDSSNSIEFWQLQKYYYKINGVSSMKPGGKIKRTSSQTFLLKQQGQQPLQFNHQAKMNRRVIKANLQIIHQKNASPELNKKRFFSPEAPKLYLNHSFKPSDTSWKKSIQDFLNLYPQNQTNTSQKIFSKQKNDQKLDKKEIKNLKKKQIQINLQEQTQDSIKMPSRNILNPNKPSLFCSERTQKKLQKFPEKPLSSQNPQSPKQENSKKANNDLKKFIPKFLKKNISQNTEEKVQKIQSAAQPQKKKVNPSLSAQNLFNRMKMPKSLFQSPRQTITVPNLKESATIVVSPEKLKKFQKRIFTATGSPIKVMKKTQRVQSNRDFSKNLFSPKLMQQNSQANLNNQVKVIPLSPKNQISNFNELYTPQFKRTRPQQPHFLYSPRNVDNSRPITNKAVKIFFDISKFQSSRTTF